MSKIFITDYINTSDIEKEVLGERLADQLDDNIEVLLVWHEHINKEYIDRLPKLGAIIRYGAGFDNIDLEYASSKGIFVCSTPDYGIDEVSDTAITMIMNIVRAVTRYDFLCRGYKDVWQENTIQSIKRTSDYTLGIIGAGRIGGSVIIKAKALKFNTVFYDPYKEMGYEKMLGARRVDSLDEILRLSDIVSMHAPLTDETKGMVSERFISKMRKGSSFVNTARGKIVSDIDLFYEPLKSDFLSSVALDVLPVEPPRSSRLIDAWRNKEEWLGGRLIINPHTAYYSENAYFEMRQKAALNALRVLNGKKPYNIVNG